MSDKETTSVTKCLLCDRDAHVAKRGLCENHYMQFRRALTSLPEDRQEAFEQQMIEQGHVLPRKRPVREAKNPFAVAARQFLTAEESAIVDQAKKAAEKLDKRKGKK